MRSLLEKLPLGIAIRSNPRPDQKSKETNHKNNKCSPTKHSHAVSRGTKECTACIRCSVFHYSHGTHLFYHPALHQITPMKPAPLVSPHCLVVKDDYSGGRFRNVQPRTSGVGGRPRNVQPRTSGVRGRPRNVQLRTSGVGGTIMRIPIHASRHKLAIFDHKTRTFAFMRTELNASLRPECGDVAGASRPRALKARNAPCPCGTSGPRWPRYFAAALQFSWSEFPGVPFSQHDAKSRGGVEVHSRRLSAKRSRSESTAVFRLKPLTTL